MLWWKFLRRIERSGEVIPNTCIVVFLRRGRIRRRIVVINIICLWTIGVAIIFIILDVEILLKTIWQEDGLLFLALIRWSAGIITVVGGTVITLISRIHSVVSIVLFLLGETDLLHLYRWYVNCCSAGWLLLCLMHGQSWWVSTRYTFSVEIHVSNSPLRRWMCVYVSYTFDYKGNNSAGPHLLINPRPSTAYVDSRHIRRHIDEHDHGDEGAHQMISY